MIFFNPLVEILFTSGTGLVRSNNEDYFGVSDTPNGIVCVVCDGMGGHKGGEVASKICVEIFNYSIF